MAYSLHTLNHVLKTRTKVLSNNERLAKVKSTKERLSMDARDQGLCRPKVVIVVPFKESARRVVECMELLLFGKKGSGGVANRKKFEDEYGKEEPVRTGSKPDDFYRTFNGNTDDGFKIGLSVSKKQLKLYAEFYSSDVIIASPLGLRMVIGSEGELGTMDNVYKASLVCMMAGSDFIKTSTGKEGVNATLPVGLVMVRYFFSCAHVDIYLVLEKKAFRSILCTISKRAESNR